MEGDPEIVDHLRALAGCKRVPRVCPCCEQGETYVATYTGTFTHNDSPLEVPGLECNKCHSCAGITIFATQARANQQRIKEAKEGLK